MIIGPTFAAETVKLTNELDKRSIPYIFVDSAIKQSFHWLFSSDHYTCGYLMSKLITSIIPKSSDIGILQAVRIGNESANTTVLRKKDL